MNITLGLRTLRAFHDAVTVDQGAKFRGHLGRVMPHIGDAYRAEEESFRNHLGASGIGKECGRAIWYSHRWATKPHFEGRMIRLFNRGHMEEGRMIALMLTIGVQVYQQDAEGKQFRISYFGGHFGGSGDGVAVGLPDLVSGQAALTEFKTHNDKSFSALAGKSWGDYFKHAVLGLPGAKPTAFDGEGVRSAKYEHWVQMQSYMRAMGLPVAMYFATNKNDDHIYAEIVQLDSGSADQYTARAGQLIGTNVAPAMINKSPAWYGCKFCDHLPVCKKGAQVERNCRTCKFSAPETEGTFAGKWVCGNEKRRLELLFPATNPLGEDFSLTKERQLMACEHYVKNETM